MDYLMPYPSIVVWVPFNEAWGQFKTKEIAEWTEYYDPSRLVNAASGGNHYYIFNSGSYRYTIERNVIGANDTAPVRLIVTQTKKVILDQSGKILDNVR